MATSENVITPSQDARWQAARQFQRATGIASALNTISKSSAAGTGKYHLRDRLTDALGRPHFFELLESEKRIADRTGRPFVLCLIDVDQLRSINDRDGQRAGDAVLFGIAERLRNVLDSPPWSESVYLHARFDGDSFMLFLPNCAPARGMQLAEALRARIAAASFAGRVKATVTIAVVAYRTFESADALVARAERTLHLAKQSGSDRVELAPNAPATGRRAQVIPLSAARQQHK